LVLNKKFLQIILLNYFAEDIIAQTHQKIDFLSTIPKEKIEIPTNYFNSFADNIIDKIKTEEQTISEGKIISIQQPKNNNCKIIFTHCSCSICGWCVIFWNKKL
jgi:hypothetical protein